MIKKIQITLLVEVDTENTELVFPTSTAKSITQLPK